MDVNAFKQKLGEAYRRKDAAGFMKIIGKFKKRPEFKLLCRQLVKENKISPPVTNIEVIVNALLAEIEQTHAEGEGVVIEGHFYEIAEALKEHFSETLAEAFLDSQMPNDFVMRAREGRGAGDGKKLTESVIDQHKRELMRLDASHAEVAKALQSSSYFPVEVCRGVGKSLVELFVQLKSNYKYISVKPLIRRILEIGGEDVYSKGFLESESPAYQSITLFKAYIESGEEPDFSQQIAFHIAIRRLFAFIKKNGLLSADEYQRHWTQIQHYLSYRSKSRISDEIKLVLDELLAQINFDRVAILKKLSRIFLDEYQCAEDLMLIRYRMIETELLYTREYLERIKADSNRDSGKSERQIELAFEKVFFLQDIFPIPEWRMETVRSAGMIELEHSAFGVSADISPKQLTEWIRIYSILFSNSDLVMYSGKEINFLVMRQLISHLTTYHLIQNVTQLKRMVDQALSASTGDAADRLQQFNEALKIKLQGLLNSSKSSQKSFKEMIEELGFIRDKKLQFLIADTFSGFQIIADAFNSSAKDYFVKDRQALIRESRALYNDICNQCLKGLLPRAKKTESKQKKSRGAGRPWLSRVFST